MKKYFLISFILLAFAELNEIKGQGSSQDFGTIKVLYIHKLREQLFLPLQQSFQWKGKTYLNPYMNPEVRKIKQTLDLYYKEKRTYTIDFLLGLKPPKELKCTRYYKGLGRTHTSKIQADRDKVFVAVERKKKQLAFILFKKNYYVIQYREGNRFDLIFELAVGEDYIIALFHKEEKIYWTGNMKKIAADKAWKLYNPSGMYPFEQVDVAYFKAQVSIHFD